MTNNFKTLLIACAVALILSACATTVAVDVRGDGGERMRGAFSHNFSSIGDFSFEHTDGEQFSGQYWIVSGYEFQTRMRAIFGLGNTVGFGASALSTLYYLNDLVGSRGSTAFCGYAINLIGWTNFTGTGQCQDSKSRRYTMIMSSDDEVTWIKPKPDRSETK